MTTKINKVLIGIHLYKHGRNSNGAAKVLNFKVRNRFRSGSEFSKINNQNSNVYNLKAFESDLPTTEYWTSN